jgi:hypothetical protein
MNSRRVIDQSVRSVVGSIILRTSVTFVARKAADLRVLADDVVVFGEINAKRRRRSFQATGCQDQVGATPH